MHTKRLARKGAGRRLVLVALVLAACSQPADGPAESDTLPTDLTMVEAGDLWTGHDGDEVVCQPSCAGKQCGDDGCGGSCGDCDDSLPCTANECIAGQCAFPADKGACAIDGECYEDGSDNPDNVCLVCDAAADQEEWQDQTDGTDCGGGSICYEGECCPAADNCTGLECGDDGCGGTCGKCTGSLSCASGICVEPDSCLGSCGGSSPSKKCHCDDECFNFGDCCEDVCAACPDLEHCNCIPDCEDKECGDDGCGGTCGECADDFNVCTKIKCEEGTCTTIDLQKPCDDDNPCTEDDSCMDGVCVGIPLPPEELASANCICDEDEDCAVLDQNVCDGILYCAKESEGQTGVCSPKPNSALDCNDDNMCTQDVCHPEEGCLNTPLSDLPCVDDNACLAGDTCVDGECIPGTQELDCDDDNECTVDSCDPNAGCQYEIKTGPCDDGNECTTQDLCQDGVCVGTGSQLDCDDGNPCTDDSCSIQDGCAHEYNTAPCDDGNACTLGDVCSEGACQTGTESVDCNDDNACTEDSCDPAMGCQHIMDEGSQDDWEPNDGDDESVELEAISDCLACIPGLEPPLNLRVFEGKLTAPADIDCFNVTIIDEMDQEGPDGGEGDEAPDVALAVRLKEEVEFNYEYWVLDCDGSELGAHQSGTATGTLAVAAYNRECKSGGDDVQVRICVSATLPADTCAYEYEIAVTETDDLDCSTPVCFDAEGDDCVEAVLGDGKWCFDGNLCTTGDSCLDGACQSGPDSLYCNDGDDCTEDGCDETTGCTFTPFATDEDKWDSKGLGNSLDEPAHLGIIHDSGTFGAPNCDLTPVPGFMVCPTGPAEDCQTRKWDATLSFASDEDHYLLSIADESLSCGADGTPDMRLTISDVTDSAIEVSYSIRCGIGTLDNLGDEIREQSGIVVEPGAAPLVLYEPDFDCPGGADGASLLLSIVRSPDAEGCTASYAVEVAEYDCTDPAGEELDCSTSCAGGNLDEGDVCWLDLDPCRQWLCQAGECAPIPANEGQACDDSGPCTLDAACTDGVCTATQMLDCDDANSCTEDTCDGEGGCIHLPAPAGVCSDGDLCNGEEVCQDGTCLPGTPLDCADGNPCTADTCDPDSGCINTPDDTLGCADGSTCNGTETCQDGACIPGIALDCDDGDNCTIDTCDEVLGCQHTTPENLADEFEPNETQNNAAELDRIYDCYGCKEDLEAPQNQRVWEARLTAPVDKDCFRIQVDETYDHEGAGASEADDFPDVAVAVRFPAGGTFNYEYWFDTCGDASQPGPQGSGVAEGTFTLVAYDLQCEKSSNDDAWLTLCLDADLGGGACARDYEVAVVESDDLDCRTTVCFDALGTDCVDVLAAEGTPACCGNSGSCDGSGHCVLDTPCPEGTITAGCGCFVLVEEALDIEQATAACVAKGGHLAAPTNASENDDLVAALLAAGADHDVTIGLVQDPAQVEEVPSDYLLGWQWLNNGQPVEASFYGNWSPGLDNWNGAEDCAELQLLDVPELSVIGAWNDIPCSHEQDYLCEGIPGANCAVPGFVDCDQDPANGCETGSGQYEPNETAETATKMPKLWDSSLEDHWESWSGHLDQSADVDCFHIHLDDSDDPDGDATPDLSFAVRFEDGGAFQYEYWIHECLGAEEERAHESGSAEGVLAATYYDMNCAGSNDDGHLTICVQAEVAPGACSRRYEIAALETDDEDGIATVCFDLADNGSDCVEAPSANMVAPEAPVISTEGGETLSADPLFVWTMPADASQYATRLDDGPWTAWTPGEGTVVHQEVELAEGPHTFFVKVAAPYGQQLAESAPASVGFVVADYRIEGYWDVAREITTTPMGRRDGVSCHACYLSPADHPEMDAEQVLADSCAKIAEALAKQADLFELDVAWVENEWVLSGSYDCPENNCPTLAAILDSCTEIAASDAIPMVRINRTYPADEELAALLDLLDQHRAILAHNGRPVLVGGWVHGGVPSELYCCPGQAAEEQLNVAQRLARLLVDEQAQPLVKNHIWLFGALNIEAWYAGDSLEPKAGFNGALAWIDAMAELQNAGMSHVAILGHVEDDNLMGKAVHARQLGLGFGFENIGTYLGDMRVAGCREFADLLSTDYDLGGAVADTASSSTLIYFDAWNQDDPTQFVYHRNKEGTLPTASTYTANSYTKQYFVDGQFDAVTVDLTALGDTGPQLETAGEDSLFGMRGGTLAFDGVDDRLVTYDMDPDDVEPGTQGLLVALVANLSGIEDMDNGLPQNILGKCQGSGWCLLLTGGPEDPVLKFSVNVEGLGYKSAVAPLAPAGLEPDQTHLILAAYDTYGGLYLVVDGVKANPSVQTATAPINPNDAPLIVGADPTSTTNGDDPTSFFRGRIQALSVSRWPNH